MQSTSTVSPRTYTQLILRSLSLYGQSFAHVFLLSLALSFIVFIPRLIGSLIGHDILENVSDYNLQKLWLIPINFVVLIIFVALLWRIWCVYTHAHDSLLDDIRVALKKIIYIIVASFLQTLLVLMIFLAAFLLIYLFIFHQILHEIDIKLPDLIIIMSLFALQFILALYIFIRLYFYLPIIVVENKTILGALMKSTYLVKHNLGRVILVQLTPWIYYLLLLLLIKFGLRINIHIYFLPTAAPQLVPTLMHIIFFALFIPWVATLLLLQLKDLELRHAPIT